MSNTTEEQLSRPQLDEMVPYEPGKPVEEIEREYGLEQPPIKLASNENPFPPPNDLMDTYRHEFDRLNRYPDGGSYYLREALAEFYDWPMDSIIVGGGSDEVLDCLAKATLNPGDEVLTGKPAFVRYRMVAQMMGATPVEVPLTDSLDFDLSQMRDRITSDTAWVCLPNPNNPTSRFIDEESMSAFLKSLPEHVIVILDEAYFEFMEDSAYPDGTDWLMRRRETDAHTVVLRTFSKAYGLAGLRVGYGWMDETIANEIHKIRPPFNVTRPAQALAVEALECGDYIEECRETIIHQRQFLVEEIQQLGLEVVPPTANFMLVKAPHGDGGQLAENLMKQGVIVRPMGPYGLDEYIRLTVGTPSENDRFLEQLEQVID